jgi:hypothetical protein
MQSLPMRRAGRKAQYGFKLVEIATVIVTSRFQAMTAQPLQLCKDVVVLGHLSLLLETAMVTPWLILPTGPLAGRTPPISGNSFVQRV